MGANDKGQCQWITLTRIMSNVDQLKSGRIRSTTFSEIPITSHSWGWPQAGVQCNRLYQLKFGFRLITAHHNSSNLQVR